MILSPRTYLHIKALIKFSKESNAHFKTHSKAFRSRLETERFLFLISDGFFWGFFSREFLPCQSAVLYNIS